MQVATCPRCEGTGQIFDPCNTCAGDGRVRESKRISLKVRGSGCKQAGWGAGCERGRKSSGEGLLGGCSLLLAPTHTTPRPTQLRMRAEEAHNLNSWVESTGWLM